jgi:hypothetical protein
MLTSKTTVLNGSIALVRAASAPQLFSELEKTMNRLLPFNLRTNLPLKSGLLNHERGL